MPEDLANARSRLAVESRMSPLFVHDPRKGETLAERFSLEGNPEPEDLWTTTTLTYRDEQGRLQLLTLPLTPADFAIGEVRFAQQFRWLATYEEAGSRPDRRVRRAAPAPARRPRRRSSTPPTAGSSW